MSEEIVGLIILIIWSLGWSYDLITKGRNPFISLIFPALLIPVGLIMTFFPIFLLMETDHYFKFLHAIIRIPL